MQEMIEGIRVMPGWAQAGLGFFVLCFVVMIGEPRVKARRVRRQFRDLVCGLGVAEPAGEDAPAIYLRGPLLEALEHTILRPLEYAPLFDRAVESLMAGAESLSG